MQINCGYVYILTNEAMPSIVKVGKTKNPPSARVEQLSSATGVPSKFSLFREYQVTDCDEAESLAHRVLERVFGRPNSQREFFSGEATDVAAILDDALAPFAAVTDPIRFADFQPAISRVLNKEFTLARVEFEELFRAIPLSEATLRTSDTLLTAAGAYVACCYATSSRPIDQCVLGVTVKHRVMSKAIDFASEFEDDAASSIISFVRKL